MAVKAKKRDPRKELKLLIRSRYPIIYMETWEEERAQELVEQVAEELGVPLYVWTVTTGLVRVGTRNPLYHSESPRAALSNVGSLRGDALFLLKDFHRHWEAPEVVRLVRDLQGKFRGRKSSLLVTAPSVSVPMELQKDVARFQLGLPDAKDFQQVILPLIREVEESGRIVKALDGSGRRRLARNLCGLTLAEGRRVLRRCLLSRRRLDPQTILDVLIAKREELGRSGVLEFVELGEDFAALADLRNLKKWLQRRRGAFTPEAEKFGLHPPLGILILGVQGCGKSLLAKAVAFEWQIPLVRLDPGRLYDKYIGESEKQLRQSLEGAAKMAPLVLWIDEIEKGFAASAGAADVDAGLSQRMLGTLLSWLQEKRAPVFVTATCNNISTLPPELLRKGRFDEIFFVDLPDAEARRQVFRIHLEKRQRNPEEFDLEALAAAAEDFSGAELEQVVISGLYTAFAAKKSLDTAVLLAELKSTYPLAVTRREDIERLRQWARGRAVPAN
ncbi:MAG: AAA family ATPase [Terriglobia bacterium]